MRLTCDSAKVEAIKNEPELSQVWTNEKYKNPCQNPMIPYFLAYVEYWSLKNAKASSEYYKIASANTDAPV